MSSATSCISAITTRCPVQAAVSPITIPDVGWNLMDPFLNSQKFRCRCLHGVTSSRISDSPCQWLPRRISDSPCQWLPTHSLLCWNQWQTECLPLNSVLAKHQMSGATRSSSAVWCLWCYTYHGASPSCYTILIQWVLSCSDFLQWFIEACMVFFHGIWHFWAMHR